ncbi:aldolase/citrate lyase family protein [Castellaniella sp.]|uniref:aldolase/citrate lyase family protein n=1 Tax=Castellaniella sp. TaxID=1955812 RepID=UPI002AFDEB29|nr:aldolase/citrate lyase family protein [Castellaniella sp.]
MIPEFARRNRFKHALTSAVEPRIGLFLGLGDPGVAEWLGDTAFDWLLLDGEHGLGDLRTVLLQLRALQGSASDVLVRVVDHDAARIKQGLDIGVQTLLVPMVKSAA